MGRSKQRLVMEVESDWAVLFRKIVTGSKVTFNLFMQGAVEAYVKQVYEQTKGYIDAINAGDISNDDEKALKNLKADLQAQLDLYQPFYEAFCQSVEPEPSPEDAKPKRKGR